MALLRVCDLMTCKPVSVYEEDDLDSVYELMLERNIRHIPVLDRRECLVGIISQRDLSRKILYAEDSIPFKDLREMLKALSARSVMTRVVHSVGPDTPARDAGRLLLGNKFGCLPVTERGLLTGILTEADFVRFVVERCEGNDALFDSDGDFREAF